MFLLWLEWLDSSISLYVKLFLLTCVGRLLTYVLLFFSFFLQWFLERWNGSHAVLGMIGVIFIERAIHKILISVFLSREFKHDETNRAWWTGKWYGRGLGAYAMSQPAREFIVKVIESRCGVRISFWDISSFLCWQFLYLFRILIRYMLLDFSGYALRDRFVHRCIR